jgi:hypothetical protein
MVAKDTAVVDNKEHSSPCTKTFHHHQQRPEIDKNNNQPEKFGGDCKMRFGRRGDNTTMMTKKKKQQSTTGRLERRWRVQWQHTTDNGQWRRLMRGGKVGCRRQEARVKADERRWQGWVRQATGGLND